ncbi:MAG: PAAR domain-containing protein [Polyangiaceae bacterium]
MGQPIAKQGDHVFGVDTHVVMVPSPGGPVPTPMPNPFAGQLTDNLSGTVFVDNKPVAMVDSVANNLPAHLPMGGPFQKPPANKGTVTQGSATVFVDNKGVARRNDPAKCCNDPADQDTGHIVATGTAFCG